MTKYGIADIGSNTVVLMIYTMNNGIPETLFYRSVPAHLIRYVHNGVMSQEGILKAGQILQEYDAFLDAQGVDIRYACITEPGRTANKEELFEVLNKTKFTVIPLSGEEEAECEYLGAKIFFPDISSGTAFDIGGGSSELIAFREGRMTAAVSLPAGCVRMQSLPADTDVFRKMLENVKDHPALERPCRQLIGIGGTVRAAGLLASSIFHTGHTLPKEILQLLYNGLTEGDPVYTEAKNKVIDPSRHPFLLPGIRMILDLCAFFEADTILISEMNVREGFLVKYAAKEESRY